jgi:hypothetical protein
MLNETMNLEITESDDTTLKQLVYKKKTHADDTALYRNEAVILAPELPPDQFSLRIIEAKAASNFYGTRKNFVTLRQDVLKPTPTGDRLLPLITKIETSSPIGFTADEMRQQLKLVNAFLIHDIYASFYKYQEI